MSNTIIYTIISLSSAGALFGIILYLIAQRFKVCEDPRIHDIEQALPGANCGGCGYPGCRNFAEALVKAEDLSTLYCPVGGNICMANVAKILGKEAVVKEPMIAVVRCSGSHEHQQKTNIYDGAQTCVIADNYYLGDTDCKFGCLGLGDCVRVCKFDAIYMDDETGLPVVVEDKCTACGACVVACPRDIIELRKKGPKGRRIFISCISKDKGVVAKKACAVACIGCGKCVKVCPFEAITLENFLAYIDFEKCKLCRKCAPECPTNAIHELHFPPKKPQEAGDKTSENVSVSNSKEQ